MDYKAYDDLRFSHYLNYCICLTEYGYPLQATVKNDHLLAWYFNQWINMVEKPLLHQIKDFVESGIDEPSFYNDLLKTYVNDINDFYPRIILKVISESLKPQQKMPTKA